MKKEKMRYYFVANEDKETAGWLLNKYGMQYYIFKIRDEILEETSYALQVPQFPAFTGSTLDELFKRAGEKIEIREF